LAKITAGNCNGWEEGDNVSPKNSVALLLRTRKKRKSVLNWVWVENPQQRKDTKPSEKRGLKGENEDTKGESKQDQVGNRPEEKNKVTCPPASKNQRGTGAEPDWGGKDNGAKN